jgi:CheY-like chemotaxis protein
MGNVIGFNLKKAGLEVVHVVSGEQAWRLLQQRDFDLLVTDFQMPGMNGGDLCRWIRQEPALAAFPVILLTAKGLEIDAAYYRETLGVSAVLTKPFSPRELTRLVQENLAAGASIQQTG